MFKYILNRLTERSTWLGIIALATACGATIEAAIAEQMIAAGKYKSTGMDGTSLTEEQRDRLTQQVNDT